MILCHPFVEAFEGKERIINNKRMGWANLHAQAAMLLIDGIERQFSQLYAPQGNKR